MQAAAAPTPSQPLSGLSEREVSDRRKRGQSNRVRLDASRSYRDILRSNVFTFLNMVLFAIGLTLLALGLYADAMSSMGIAALNIVVGLVQEVRAKQSLDKIALLTRPKATVMRAGKERVIDPNDIVLGDILVVRPGDQIVVDGLIVGNGKADVDESLLTGESDLIPKTSGDEVLSGSFVVNGSVLYEAKRVGDNSFANKLTKSARAYKYVKTPLQLDVELVVRILIVLSVILGILFTIAVIVAGEPITEGARIAAVVTGLIPNGLFFMISIAYAMGAVRMAGQGALIQQTNAVENMSHVNMLCLDKTGTLTANHIVLNHLLPLDTNDIEFRHFLSIFAASATTANRTSEALALACPGEKRPFVDETPFSSLRKWSALSFDQPDIRGVYVLGAPEMLRPYLREQDKDFGVEAKAWLDQGLRVLLFAYSPEISPLHDSLDKPQLPPDLVPLGVLSFSDVLRPEAGSTLQNFKDTGIQLKIISGDHPDTVSALARQAGLGSDALAISGEMLNDMTAGQLADAVDTHTIFGRITPQQKEILVDTLKARGYYVAMIGDGVNDVLSLKKAHIGIAMQSGSQAARGVADIILMNDSFAALPLAFREGQRIINGMQDIMRLFLSRAAYQTLVIIGAAIVGLGFPVTPVHQSLLSLLTVGIPMFFMAAWARPAIPRHRLILAVVRFVLPAGFSLALVGLTFFSLYNVRVFHSKLESDLGFQVTSVAQANQFVDDSSGDLRDKITAIQEEALSVARTVLNSVTTFGGLVLIFFVEPPTHFWTGGDDYSGDWRPTLLALLMGTLYVGILATPAWREVFELHALTIADYELMFVALVIWAFGLRLLWRRDWLGRFLRLPV